MSHTYIPHTKSGHPLPDAMIAISMHAVPGLLHTNKFGTNSDISTAYETVWANGNGWQRLVAPTTLEVASTDADDTVAGSGAQYVFIGGLDENGLLTQDVVAMNGQTPVVTTQVFSFVNRAYVYQAGASEANEGIIRIADDSATWSSGVPTDDTLTQGHIAVLLGQTQQCIFKVPADYVGYVTQGYVSVDRAKVCTYRVWAITPNNVRRVQFEGTVSGGHISHRFLPYAQVGPGTILYMDAQIDVGNASVSAGLDIILVALNQHDED